MKKKLIWGSLLLFAFFLSTNPSLRDFKDNGHDDGYKAENWILFSVFKIHEDEKVYTYVGFCKNFWEVNEEYQPPTYIIKQWH